MSDPVKWLCQTWLRRCAPSGVTGSTPEGATATAWLQSFNDPQPTYPAAPPAQEALGGEKTGPAVLTSAQEASSEARELAALTSYPGGSGARSPR
jgi:hypothetical protein